MGERVDIASAGRQERLYTKESEMSDPTAPQAPHSSSSSSPAFNSASHSPSEATDTAVEAANTATAKRATPEPADDASLENLESLTRFLIGASLEASDELLMRLRRWQEQTRTALLEARPETPADRLRYALVGLVFEAEGRAHARLYRMGQSSAQAAQRVVTAIAPFSRRLAVGPLRERSDELAIRMRDTVDRWTARGRLEERQGRLVARQAVTSVMDEVLQHMAHDPEVQELIRQQGVGLATTAVETVREHAQSADVWAERIVHGFFRRPARERAADGRRSPATTVPLTSPETPPQSV
jgi:hypothetical protein